MTKTWKTDAADLAAAVDEFEHRLPGFWWTVGQCSVGAHASCAVDGNGVQAHLLALCGPGEPLDSGFYVATEGGTPAEALRAVMGMALAFLESVVAEEEAR